MKKLIIFIISVLLLAGCAVQKNTIPSHQPEITEYRSLPEMVPFGINGVVYIMSLNRDTKTTNGGVKCNVIYRQVFDLYCGDIPNANNIDKPLI